MRPRATMPVVLYVCVPAINSFAPPPAKITAPVSPSYPCKRWSPLAPTDHTTILLVPSVEVTNGEPTPLWVTLQTLVIVGGLVGLIRKAESREPLARKTTYVPWLVRSVAAAWIIA